MVAGVVPGAASCLGSFGDGAASCPGAPLRRSRRRRGGPVGLIAAVLSAARYVKRLGNYETLARRRLGEDLSGTAHGLDPTSAAGGRRV